MLRYILKKLGATIIVLICVSFLSFALIRLAPGDPALMMLPENATQEDYEAMRAYLGLDKPFLVQYGVYMVNILKGDFGTSTVYKLPCIEVIGKFFPATVELAVAASFIGFIVAIPLGIIAGVKRGTLMDVGCMFFAMVGQSLSVIVLGLMLVIVFSVKLNWLPSMGSEGFKSLILPALTLGLPQAATTTRMARSGMVDVLKEDYITATYARGVSEGKVYTKYALKNAIIPVITVVGMSFAILIGGSVVTENIFGWPGIGTLVKTSISSRDYAMVQALLMVIATMVALINLLVDIINSLVDRRIVLR